MTKYNNYSADKLAEIASHKLETAYMIATIMDIIQHPDSANSKFRKSVIDASLAITTLEKRPSLSDSMKVKLASLKNKL